MDTFWYLISVHEYNEPIAIASMLSGFYSLDYCNIETIAADPVEHSTNVGLTNKKRRNASFSIYVT